jgi:hypothetical protein
MVRFIPILQDQVFSRPKDKEATMNHAIVNKEGKVVNVVWWTGGEWLPPRDHMVIRTDVAGIGDSYDHATGIFDKVTGHKAHRDTKYEDFVSGKELIN